MKITKEHYDHIEKVITEKLYIVGQTMESAVNHCRHTTGYTDKKIRWLLLNGSGLTPFVCNTLYKYLNDSHIDTALRKITNTK